MSIYDSLNQWLLSSRQSSVRISFSDVEKLLGRTLPRSAYTYRAWWANGRHSQANAWLNAGYKVTDVNLGIGIVIFSKSEESVIKKISSNKTGTSSAFTEENNIKNISAAKTINVCGYVFSFIQDLIPDCDKHGNVIKYYPQASYDNQAGLALLAHGKGAFCRFSITADNRPGVYLWIEHGQIIYIGETVALRQRFNTGYGNISPRNCYEGGQSTNCKMNKVVLDHFERGNVISLYFYRTADYKRVELELLNKICTPYNVKDN